MGRSEKEMREQTGEKLAGVNRKLDQIWVSVQLYWHPTCLRVRGTSQRGLKPGGYQQLFQCLKVGELEYRWLFLPGRLTWQSGKYGGSSTKLCARGWGAYVCFGVEQMLCKGQRLIDVWTTRNPTNLIILYPKCCSYYHVFQFYWAEHSPFSSYPKEKRKITLLCRCASYFSVFWGRSLIWWLLYTSLIIIMMTIMIIMINTQA